MKNKEIEELLDIEKYRNKEGYVENINLIPDELHQLLDYITKLQQENQQLKKQKDDVVEYIKNNFIEGEVFYSKSWLKMKKKELLRMLGDSDE